MIPGSGFNAIGQPTDNDAAGEDVDVVVFVLSREKRVQFRRDAFSSLPESMPATTLASELSADQVDFDFRDHDATVFEAILSHAYGETLNVPDGVSDATFFRELDFWQIKTEPERTLPDDIKAELTSTTEVMVRHLVSTLTPDLAEWLQASLMLLRY